MMTVRFDTVKVPITVEASMSCMCVTCIMILWALKVYSYGHQMFVTSDEQVYHALAFCEKMYCYKQELRTFAGIGVLHVASCKHTLLI